MDLVGGKVRLYALPIGSFKEWCNNIKRRGRDNTDKKETSFPIKCMPINYQMMSVLSVIVREKDQLSCI